MTGLSRILIGLFVLASCSPPAQALSQVSESAVHESARHDFRIVSVVEGLDHPWSIAWLPNGDMVFTERPGRLRIVRNGVLDPDPISGFPPVYRDVGQGGFMDIVPHPNFDGNQLLYLSYGKPNADASLGATTIVRGRLVGDRVTEVEEIFESDAWGDNNNHFSGRMVFDLEGYLYLSVGDRMVNPDMMFDHPAQDVSNHLGTIVRLNDDGSVPADNPFVGHPNARPEIWSYGHRNPQGMAVDPVTGDLWITDHGPRGGDELDLIVRGGNYGWPVASYGIHYNGSVFTTDLVRAGMESPKYAWIPSIGTSGLTIYRGDEFPWWNGNALAGGMVGQQLGRVTLEGHDAVSLETLLEGVLGRIRDVRTGPDGFIYLGIEDNTGQRLTEIVRLEMVRGSVQPPG